VEQLPPALHLGIGAVPDLPPDSVRRVGVGQPLGDDALEVKPLDGPKQVSAATPDAKDGGSTVLVFFMSDKA
jgi:hypothetical protein